MQIDIETNIVKIYIDIELVSNFFFQFLKLTLYQIQCLRVNELKNWSMFSHMWKRSFHKLIKIGKNTSIRPVL